MYVAPGRGFGKGHALRRFPVVAVVIALSWALASGSAVAQSPGGVCLPAESTYGVWGTTLGTTNELSTGICVSNESLRGITVSIEMDRGTLEVISTDPGTTAAAQGARATISIPAASAGAGQTVAIGARFRVVGPIAADPGSARTDLNATVVASGERLMTVMGVPTPYPFTNNGRYDGGLPPCSLANVADRTIGVEPGRVSVRQLGQTGLLASLPTCPAEELTGFLYVPGVPYYTGGSLRYAGLLQQNTSHPLVEQGTNSVRIIVPRKSLSALAGAEQVRVVLEAQRTSFLVPTSVVVTRLVPLSDGPIPLGAPALSVRRSGDAVDLAVEMRLSKGLRGRRAIIERLSGSRYVRLGVAPVASNGLVRKSIRVSRDLRGTRIRVRVRLLASGKARAVGGRTAAIRLP